MTDWSAFAQSHFAVIWTDGGFTKFEVATLQAVQTVRRVPPAQYCQSSTNHDESEITHVTEELGEFRTFGGSGMRQLSGKVSRKGNCEGGEVQDDEFFALDEEDDELVDPAELD